MVLVYMVGMVREALACRARVLFCGAFLNKIISQKIVLDINLAFGCSLPKDLFQKIVTCDKTTKRCIELNLNILEHFKQEHKVSYRCSLPSPLQKRS